MSITIPLKNLCFLFILGGLFTVSAQAQGIAPGDLRKLKIKEDSLSFHARNLTLDSIIGRKMRSDSLFVRTLIRSLQVKNSFFYPFDSVLGISKIYAPDSSFRIFSWTFSYDDYYSRQRAAIQMRTKDGSLRLIPLIDVSEFTDNAQDSVRTRNNWIGATYYNIIKTEHNGKSFYTLFGIDNHTNRSNKKWIEVLTFNSKNEPLFGGPFFSFHEDSIKRPVQHRFSIEYKEDARTFVNYDPEMQLILVDHLISESDEPESPWTLVPDGDYEGFKWQDGKWVHVDKVFHFKLKDGEAPIIDPILDPKGNKDENKLQQKSDKNKGKSGGGRPDQEPS